MYLVLCTMYFVMSKINFVMCKMYFVMCIMYIVMCIMYFVMCTMFFVICTMYFAMCILYFVMCTMYFVMWKIYFVMCKILNKLLYKYCNRSCISINLSGTQNNSLCWPIGLSCRNVLRLCPVNFKLRVVLTFLYDGQTSWWWWRWKYRQNQNLYCSFYSFPGFFAPPHPSLKNTVINGDVIKWRILLSTICSGFLSKCTLYKILFSRKYAGSVIT